MKPLDMIIKVTTNLLSVRLVHISILFLVAINGCQSNKKRIVYADVYSLDWLMTTRADLSAEKVMNWQGDQLVIYKIQDRETLDLLDEELQRLKIASGFDSIDTRMVCILHYSDGNTEKLEFGGGSQLTYYKGLVYERDSVLIQRIEGSYHP